MRATAPFLIASVLVAASPAEAARLTPAERLAREVDGRVAGEPVDCIDIRRIRSTRIITDTAIIYEVGSTLYVNRPRGGAQSLDQWKVLVTRPTVSQLCSIDVVHLYDQGSRMQTGVVFLGPFVPYERVDSRPAR